MGKLLVVGLATGGAYEGARRFLELSETGCWIAAIVVLVIGMGLSSK